MSKRVRTLDSFFSPPPLKRAKAAQNVSGEEQQRDEHGDTKGVSAAYSRHAAYPFPIIHLPMELREMLNFVPAAEARAINDQPELDLLSFTPFIPKAAQVQLFEFLRAELPFYRVKYTIKRGPVETVINTPRFTTVFGVDDTARFRDGQLTHAISGSPLAKDSYKCCPRPLPQCLDVLRELTENATGCRFNFALVNYYATGSDSISYHSDDERFLGADPAIASFTLGQARDFLLKHKPTPMNHASETKPTKMPLGPGDMLLMRGKTQSNWLHSIPKRQGRDAHKGRINITFRRALIRAGSENYYRYNVGDGIAYRWSASKREMVPDSAMSSSSTEV